MAKFTEWFVNLPLHSALYWLCFIILIALVCAAGFDWLLDQAFPEEQQ